MGATLYDRWQERYDSLESGAVTSLYAPVLAKILRYLLDRYREQPEAALPAVGPSPKMPLWANERAIVVAQYAGVKSEAEAQSRVTGVLARMAAPSTAVQPPDLPADSDWQWPSQEEMPAVLSPPFEAYWVSQLRRERWEELSRWIVESRDKETEHLAFIAECLESFHVIPRAAVPFLGECAADTDRDSVERACRAGDLLAICENRSALQVVLSAWRRRLSEGHVDQPLVRLEQYFLAHPDPSAEAMCGELASNIALVRLRATEALAEIGTLYDAPLLGDLLVVAPTPDEHPRERDALSTAIERLAERFPPGG